MTVSPKGHTAGKAFAEACERAQASSQEKRARPGAKMRAALKSTSLDAPAAAVQQ
jgi:hypothetical protein